MSGVVPYIEMLLAGEDLSFEQATEVMDMIFGGEVEDLKIAAILTALRIKGLKASELAGFAKSLRGHAVQVKTGLPMLIDTCGTGGSKVKTFNISTAAAIVAAGAGVYVAKHGNRAITSSCGSADVLAALGVKIDSGAEKAAECIKKARIGFMFAPMFHPAMKTVQPIRKGLGFMTVFNMLGPLANPASASAQVLGVPDEKIMPLVAEALRLLGVKHVMVVSSSGLDEISTTSKTKIIEIRDNTVKTYELDPAQYGFSKPDTNELKGADATTNAWYVMEILAGKDKGPRRDIVVLNAAAAIITAERAENFESGIALAAQAIDNGSAYECLRKLIEISNG
jgi:anthranilate phosphoribosyltransferase